KEDISSRIGRVLSEEISQESSFATPHRGCHLKGGAQFIQYRLAGHMLPSILFAKSIHAGTAQQRGAAPGQETHVRHSLGCARCADRASTPDQFQLDQLRGAGWSTPGRSSSPGRTAAGM